MTQDSTPELPHVDPDLPLTPEMFLWPGRKWHSFIKDGCHHPRTQLVFKWARKWGEDGRGTRVVVGNSHKLFYRECVECGMKCIDRHPLHPKKQTARPGCRYDWIPVSLLRQANFDIEAIPEGREPITDYTRVAALPYFEKRRERSRLWFSRYDLYLKSKRWRVLRSTILDVVGSDPGCFIHSTLPLFPRTPAVLLHHPSYRTVGREKPHELLPLCQVCHDDLHVKNPWFSRAEPVSDLEFQNYLAHQESRRNSEAKALALWAKNDLENRVVEELRARGFYGKT